MPIIPDPSDLLSAARSTMHPIEDREWKQYQRYLRKYKPLAITPDKPPLTFDEFCDDLRKKHNQS